MGASTQARRDQILARAIVEILGTGYEVTGRMGPDRFTLLSRHDLTSLFRIRPDDLEKRLNQNFEAGFAQ